MDFLFCKECHSSFQKTFILESTLRPQIVCPFCGSSNLAQSVDELPQIKKIELESIQKSDLSSPQIKEAEGDAACGKMQAPFDDRKNGFWGAYFKNIQALLFHPQDYFKKYQLFRKTKTAWLFAILSYGLFCLWEAILFLVRFSLKYSSLLHDPTLDLQKLRKSLFGVYGLLMASLLLFVLLFPILQSILSFLWASVHHFFIIALGGSKKAFSQTLQVHLLFASIAIICIFLHLFVLLLEIDYALAEFAFSLFAIYAIFYFTKSMADTHEISVGRAFLSLLGTIFIICVLFGLFIVYFGAFLLSQLWPNQ